MNMRICGEHQNGPPDDPERTRDRGMAKDLIVHFALWSPAHGATATYWSMPPLRSPPVGCCYVPRRAAGSCCRRGVARYRWGLHGVSTRAGCRRVRRRQMSVRACAQCERLDVPATSPPPCESAAAAGRARPDSASCPAQAMTSTGPPADSNHYANHCARASCSVCSPPRQILHLRFKSPHLGFWWG